jgi:hypothetical protein
MIWFQIWIQSAEIALEAQAEYIDMYFDALVY